MEKNNVRMTVQGEHETASDFAQDLERICHDISVTYVVIGSPSVTLTSASDGRQTATIQYKTLIN